MSTKFTQMNRDMSSRKALYRDLVTQLILHGEIKTTSKKAKLMQSIVEKLVTRAKTNDLASRREVAKTVRFLKNEEGKYAIQILFDEIAPRYIERKGGYTQIFKLGNRKGDGVEMSLIRFVK